MTKHQIDSLSEKSAALELLHSVPAASHVVVILNATASIEKVAVTEELLGLASRALRPGGLLFVYGSPAILSGWGQAMMTMPALTKELAFKYWIALDLLDTPRVDFLKPAHQGLLLFMKLNPARKTPPPFNLKVNELRAPHRNCTACRQSLKDWGGKKHLMHPLGAAPSDVWRELPRIQPTTDTIPTEILQRITRLSGAATHEMLCVDITSNPATKSSRAHPVPAPSHTATPEFRQLTRIELDRVYQGDCLAFLHRVEVLHPNGLFDLVFADPPYNLEKKYGNWDDALVEQKYLEWCQNWLASMAATLKPGGSLFVLNLPKWAIHHAAFLQQHLDLRHWIVWDALSDPRGKLMPAHYALLWFTKPGGKPVCNYSPVNTRALPAFVSPPDAPQYCLRTKCIQQRKALGDDQKVELSDIWFDIHRIKHKRDRDAHPCQLPEKLMERIIKLATRPGDVVFDPFCGAGTTAMAALKSGRRFVTTELDVNYVRITNEKLVAMREHADMFGEFVVPRASTKRQRGEITKREIESYLQQLAQSLQRLPTETDVLNDRPGLLAEMDRLYPNRGAALKRAKIVMHAK